MFGILFTGWTATLTRRIHGVRVAQSRGRAPVPVLCLYLTLYHGRASAPRWLLPPRPGAAFRYLSLYAKRCHDVAQHIRGVGPTEGATATATATQVHRCFLWWLELYFKST
ncbi:uncharacterized protein V6R79_009625 [Siganus canaliculatus]